MNMQEGLLNSFINKNIPQRYYEEFKTAEKTLPYYFNLVDEIGANENAHSKILVRLFNYKDKNGIRILLKSFLDFFYIETNGIEIINKSEFNRTCKEDNGKSRYADVFFFQKTNDKSIGVIIENKINGAKDQDNQIDAYINSLKDLGVSEENIYIFYLVAQESERKKPELQMNIEYNEGRKYADNYKLITYKEHILNWLKNTLLPSVAYGEKYLIDSMKVYVTYLENRFEFIEDRRRIQLNVLNQFKEVRELDMKNLICLENSLYQKFIEKVKNRFCVFQETPTQFIPEQDERKKKNIKLEIFKEDDLIKITLHCDNPDKMLQYPSLEDGGDYKVIEIFNYEDIDYALRRFCQLRNSSNIKAWIESPKDFELGSDYKNEISYIIAFQSAVKALIIDRKKNYMTKFSQICLGFSSEKEYSSFDLARGYYKTLNGNLSLWCELDIRAWKDIVFTIGIAKQKNCENLGSIVNSILKQVNNNINDDVKNKLNKTSEESNNLFSNDDCDDYVLSFRLFEKNLEYNYMLGTILDELPQLIDLLLSVSDKTF